MLETKSVMATSADIIHWLAPGTSWLTPTPPMRLGSWSSENADHPGAALAGNDSLPAMTASPLGASPPDTLGVQSVAVCAALFDGVAGALVVTLVEGAVVGDLLSSPVKTT